MSLQITRWSPDTCGCIIEYQWDNAVAPAERKHTVYRVNRMCPSHTGLEIVKAFDVLIGENQHKNRALAMAEELKAGASNTTTFRFDAARTLILGVPSLTPSQQDTLRQQLDARFGVGKTIVGLEVDLA